MSRASWCARGPLGVAVVCVAVLSLGGTAQAVSVAISGQRPQITSIAAIPGTIPAGGGKVDVQATVLYGTTCIFSGVGLQSLTEQCGGGDIDVGETINFAASSAPTSHVWTIYLIAKSPSGGSSRYAHTTVTQEGTELPSSLAGYLDSYAPGPSCDYGPISTSYQTYGNVAPADLGDCAFAAAADWEQLVLHVTPDPSVIGYDFAAAGGTASGGITLSALWRYWEQQGISGVTINGVDSYYTTQQDVENAVDDYGVLIAALQFGSSDYLGQYSVTAGSHVVVVDGYTPEGPLVVTWGETLQMTWQQWNAEAVGMYGISAS